MDLDMHQLLSLNDVPGVSDDDPVEVAHPPLVLVEVESHPQNRIADVETDYDAVRKNMHFQQQMMHDMAKICLENAKNSENPRFVDAFSSVMGQYTSINEKMLKLHKDMKDITTEGTGPQDKPPQTGGVNIEHATVYMSPTEIMQQQGDAFAQKEKIRQAALEVPDGD